MIPRLMLVMVPLIAAAHSAAAQDTVACAKPGKSLIALAPTVRTPPYPPMPMRNGETGTTILSVTIGQDGVPTDVTVAKSSGHSKLDDAAITEVEQEWRWRPPLKDCKPVAANTLAAFAWRIEAFGAVPKPDVAIIAAEKAYPPGAIDRLEQGDTYLNLTLGEGGVIKQAWIIRSSNYPDLDAQAVKVMEDPSTRIAGRPAGHLFVSVRWILPSRMNVTQSLDITGTVITGR